MEIKRIIKKDKAFDDYSSNDPPYVVVFPLIKSFSDNVSKLLDNFIEKEEIDYPKMEYNIDCCIVKSSYLKEFLNRIEHCLEGKASDDEVYEVIFEINKMKEKMEENDE